MNKLYGILAVLTVAAVSQGAVTTMPSPALSFSPSATPVDLTDWYLGEKSILFVHYSFGGHPDDVDMKGPPGSVCPDGTRATNINQVADALDVEDFADDCQKFGFDTVIFTAWHRGMYMLYPSALMNKWCPGHSSKRDLLGEVISALRSRGMKVIVYIHVWALPDEDKERLGWLDPTGKYLKFNDDMNLLFEELLARYGNDIAGFWYDVGLKNMDKPRLMATIKSYNPNLISYLGTDNVRYKASDPSTWIDNWKSVGRNNSLFYAGAWYAWRAEKTEGRRFKDRTVEYLYKYTVLQAATVGEGTTSSGHPYVGSVLWGAAPYVGGEGCQWENGVEADSTLFGQRFRSVQESIQGTRPSHSYVTVAGSTVNNLEYGIVATTSADGSSEYIHVLRPPSGSTLTLPAPANKAKFNAVGEMLPSGARVKVLQNASRVTITIPATQSWDPIGTVIKLGVDYTPPAPPPVTRNN